ncbi:VOC family protein [Paenibacillus sp. TAB 01]|uniref:VOC family protein n=1 Tax=Paenibacillus sp. TAB 01 TaxID=3368988 RepID=UPI00374FE61F
MILQLTPFIMLDGKAHEAIRFYEEALGAKVVFKQTFGEGPQNPVSPLSEEEKARVAHSVLKIGEAELMVSDSLPGASLEAGSQVNICLVTTDAAQAGQVYDALSAGGQVHIPLGEIHFSPAYGMITDRYGVTFQVFTQRPR